MTNACLLASLPGNGCSRRRSSTGPLKTTNVLTYYIYDQLQFAKNDGKAAVLAIALFGVTLLLTLIQFQFLERRVSYER